MQQVVRAIDLVAAPWKNGGGLTREVLTRKEGDRLIWRLSIADVDKDGPFSTFSGFVRILTVIEGSGMDLISPDGILHARPLRPLTFAGDLPVNGRLRGGAVRNFNLIFDPKRITPSVRHYVDAQEFTLSQCQHAIHCLCGTTSLNGIQLSAGDTGLTFGGRVQLAAGAQILTVTL